MTIYQFDKCFDDKKVIVACEQENLVEPFRLPNHLRDVEDPYLLSELLPKGNPLVTLDRRLAWDRSAHIPDRHPGLVIVCYSGAVVNRQITTKAAAGILRRFKERVPLWHAVAVRNSIVVITESDVEVLKIESGQLVPACPDRSCSRTMIGFRAY